MPMPDLPDFVTPTTRDAIFSSLGLDPDFALSTTVTGEYVTVQFVALDLDGRVLRSNPPDVVHTVTIPIQES